MLLNKYRWTLPFAVSLLVAIACGQFSVGKITPTADNAVGDPLAVSSSISTRCQGHLHQIPHPPPRWLRRRVKILLSSSQRRT